MLVKIAQSGEVIWEKRYGGAISDQGKAIIERPNGNLVVLGNTNQITGSEFEFEFFLLETDAEDNPL